jgi:uncharacterized RDD family membrane protein YckC
MEQYASSIFEADEARLFLASQGKRLLNLIIDRIVYGVVSSIFNYFLSGLYVDAISEVFGYNFALIFSLNIFISLCIFAFFMGGIEALFKGKTLGKLITGTKAVNEDGSNISPKTALLRGLSRMVPFEAFSALSTPCYPWHDRWTRTYVIDEKKSVYPDPLFREEAR